MDKHLYIKVWNGEGVDATPFPSAQNPARLDEFQFESTRMGAAPEIRAELMWPTCLDNEWTDNVFVEFDGEKYFLYHRPSSEKNNEDERWHHSISFRSERSLLAGIYVYDAVEGDDSPASNNTTVRYSGQLDGFIQKLNASLNVSELSSRFLVVVDDGIETEDKTLTFEDKYFNEALSDAVETWGVPYYIFNSEVSGKTEIHFGHYKTEIGDAQHPLTYRTEGLTMTKKEHSGNDVINRATGYGSNENLPWYYPNESDSGSHELGGTLNVPGQTKVDYNALSRNFENFAANNETVCWYKGYPYIVRPSFCEIFFRDTDVSKTYYDVPVRAVYAQWPEYAYNEQSGTPGYYPIFEQNKPSIVNEAFKPLQYGRLYDAYATVGFIFFLEAGQTIHMEPDIKLNLNSVNINVDAAAATKYTKVVKISGSSANIETQLSDYMLNRGHSGPVDGHRNNVEIDNEFLFTMLQDGQGTDLTEDSGKFEFTASENGLYLFEFRRRFPIPNSVPTSRQNTASFVFGLNRDLYFDIEAPHFRRMTEDTGHEMIYQDKGYILGIKANPEDGDELTISKTDWDAWMTPQPNLMPEIYRLSILDRVTNPSHPIRRFYNAKNYPFVPAAGYAPDIIAGEYIDENDGKVYNRYYFDTEGNPYLFGFPFSEKKPVEHIGRYDEIKASITGIENSDHEPIDEFLAIAYDAHDNNRFIENKEGDSETMEHPYFFVKLPKMPFNLFSCVGTEPAVISMTSGNCAACKFQILVQKDNNKNTVQVDEYGNLKRDNNGNVVFGSPQDEQQNTQTHEVWIALQKDISTYGSAQPRPFAGQQTEEGIKPEVGDKYVITGIWMPFEYILEAERRLSQQIVTDVHNNNFHKFNSGIDFSRIYLEENAEILSKLCDSAKIWVKHNNTDPAVGLYVSSFRYSMTTDALPEITVELADSLIPEQSSIQLIESRVTKAVQNMSAPAAKPITSADLSSTSEEPVILETNKGRSAITKDVLLDNLGFEQKGNINRPVFINEERKAEEIEGLDVPENIRTEKNVEAMGGVAAHGMATLQRGGGGGMGTVTGINVNGTLYEPSQGLITLPDYPTAASLISDGLASQSYVQSYFSDNFTQANIKSTLGIYDWALAASKPSYNFSEIGSKPTTLAGYGITDAHITSGVITLGGNTITPATLTNGKIPLSQIPDAILGQLIYGGTVNGSGVVTLSQNAKDKWGITSLTLTSTNYADYEGAFFIASADATSGVPSTLGLLVGDWVVATASGWGKIDNTDAVTGVKGDAESSYRIGNVNITKGNIGLGNVENTALSTWAGTSNITTLGTIATGVWHGTAIADTYIASAATWNAKYDKPSGGIPKTDLASGVQTSLGLADTALQSHQTIYNLIIKKNGTQVGSTYNPATAAQTIDITDVASANALSTVQGYFTNGVANNAARLSNTSKIGDTNQPVYFTANGVPTAISYTIGRNVAANEDVTAYTAGTYINVASHVISAKEASGSQGGVVTTSAQTFSGDKTFNDNIQSMKGVAARGMATLQRSGGGGSGTLTQIQINGTPLTDVSGVVNIPLASNSANGAMSSADKSKLDNIEAYANNYVLPAATNGALGGISLGYSASGKNYPVQLDGNNKAYVNVPWENTTYSNGTGLDLSSGVFSINSTYQTYISNGNTAYGWGNHADAGYFAASSFTKANIKSTLGISDWALAASKPSYAFSEITGTASESQIPTLAISKISGLQTALDNKLATSLKGAANGLAELDANGLVPSSQLPSYVDDVLEYASKSAFPATGTSGKIYVALDTNLTYRWSGTAYVEISPSLALGETSSTAYRGDRGKTAYDHATDANRLTTAQSSGFYKFATTAEGHIASVTAVTASDLTSLIGSTTYAPYNSAGYLPLSGGTMSNTNLVTNLNADLLDGKHSSDFVSALGTSGDCLTWTKTGGSANNIIVPYASLATDTRVENLTNQTITYRQTAGGGLTYKPSAAVLKRVLGNSVVWNQNIRNLSYWTGTRGSVSVSNNILTYTVTEATGGTGQYAGDMGSISLIANHTYYVSSCVKTQYDGKVYLGGDGWVRMNQYADIVGNKWTRFSFVNSANNTVSGQNFYISLYSKTGGSIAVGDTMQISAPILIDLTLFFNGNIPTGLTAETFERDYGYLLANPEYNAGTIINNAAEGLETVGFNLWDEEWINGYVGNNGELIYGSSHAVTNLIPVIGGNSYYWKEGYHPTNGYLVGYDSSLNYLGLLASIATSASFTMPQNCSYVRIQYNGSFNTVINYKFNLNLSDSNRNGQYEPYKKIVLPLFPLKCKAPNGDIVIITDARKAGSVRDERVGNKFIQRVGKVVYKGTENWGRSTYGSANCFIIEITDTPISTHNAISSKYQIVSSINNIADKQLYFGQYSAAHSGIYLRDDTYSNVTDFKNALAQMYASGNPLVLNYELATPIEYEIIDEAPYEYPIDVLGTERIVSDELVAPFVADIQYGAEQRDVAYDINNLHISAGLLSNRASALESYFTDGIANNAARLSNTSAIGSTTKPVYFTANGVPSACSDYAGGTAVTLNGASKAANTASFYAPTGAGTSGQILKSTAGTPEWINQSALVAGKATQLENSRTLWGQSFNGTADIGTDKFAKMPYLLFRTVTSGSDATIGYVGRDANNNVIHLTSYSGVPVSIGSGQQDDLYITTGHNVGIGGIISPSEKLHVAGNILANGNIVANGGVAARGMATLQGGAGTGNPVTQINIGSTPYTPSSGVVSLPAYPTWSTLSGKPSNVSAFTNDSGYIDSSALAVTFTTTTLTSSSTSVYLNNTVQRDTLQKITISSASYSGQTFSIKLTGSGSYYGYHRQVLVMNNSGKNISLSLTNANYIYIGTYEWLTSGGWQHSTDNPIPFDNDMNSMFLLDIIQASSSEYPVVKVTRMHTYVD